ncbi:MAG: ADP-ribosylglycohydrolase family protein [Armatimonadota bacterium]|jgi:hypothetical protein
MQRACFLVLTAGLALLVPGTVRPPADAASDAERRISLEEYRRRMEGGWVGQIVGVGWALPTEFKYPSRIVPADEVPPWKPERIDQHFNDDLFLNLRMLQLVEAAGPEAGPRQAILAWLNAVGRRSGPAYHARNGVAPPDLSLPRYSGSGKWSYANLHMYAEWAGLICPGMPGRAADLIDRFTIKGCATRYDGRFIAALNAEAFFERDVEKLVRTALQVVPPESQYAEAIRDVLRWHAENPRDWERTWHLIQEKYFENPDYLHGLDPGPGTADAKIHAAYTALGLLYGEGDLARTVTVTMRCGQDSDCSASNAGGVLGVMLGIDGIPERYVRRLDLERPFKHVGWGLARTYESCTELARTLVARGEGRVESDDGRETWFPRDVACEPGPYVRWWDPPEPVGSRFTDEEMRRLDTVGLQWALAERLRGWEAANCRWTSGFKWEHEGRRDVLVLEPKRDAECVVLRSAMDVPGTGKVRLQPAVRAAQAWRLEVSIEGHTVATADFGAGPSGPWTELDVDLAPWRGRRVQVEIAATPPEPTREGGRRRRSPAALYIAGLSALPGSPDG